MGNNEDDVVRLKKIGSNYYQNYDVKQLYTSYYFKSIISGVEPNYHQKYEHMECQKESNVFMEQAFVLVVFSLPTQIHVSCYEHASIEEYEKGEDEQESR